MRIRARVDVSSDGRVVWRAGGHDHGWLLLSGMHFQTTSASPTYLTNFAGGNTYPSGWQRPMYSVIDGICIVDGEVTVRSWGHLLTLPPDCRPSKSIGFSLNNHENQARVDVSSDGSSSSLTPLLSLSLSLSPPLTLSLTPLTHTLSPPPSLSPPSLFSHSLSYIIIPDEFWRIVDEDGDGSELKQL